MATKILMKNTAAKSAPVLDTQTVMAMVAAYADTLLQNAYTNFRRAPTGGDTWKDMRIAMMVYQQAKVAAVSESKQKELAAAITTAPIGTWGELIVQAVTGMSIGEALGEGN